MNGNDRMLGGTVRATAVDASSHLHEYLDVLIVDPDDDVRQLYREALASIGVRVHEAVDGRDALVQVYTVRPRVVVLDARLPFIDGIQLCSLLRQDALTATIRIVAITSNDAPDHLRRFHEFGADVVFVKPVPTEALASAVRPEACPPVPQPSMGSTPVSTPVRGRPLVRARLHERYMSTDPPQHPPHLRCPQCDGILQYQHSQIGGVSDRHPEQWDYFMCQRHGMFQYRHRTRRLRQAS